MTTSILLSLTINTQHQRREGWNNSCGMKQGLPMQEVMLFAQK